MKKYVKFFIIFSLFFTSISFAEEDSIKNLHDYFDYLPNVVHKNWVPYKAAADYEVIVQFSVNRNGEISKPVIVKSTNEKANKSVIDAVNSGVPYKNLPDSYKMNSVKTQIELRYMK